MLGFGTTTISHTRPIKKRSSCNKRRACQSLRLVCGLSTRGDADGDLLWNRIPTSRARSDLVDPQFVPPWRCRRPCLMTSSRSNSPTMCCPLGDLKAPLSLHPSCLRQENLRRNPLCFAMMTRLRVENCAAGWWMGVGRRQILHWQLMAPNSHCRD